MLSRLNSLLKRRQDPSVEDGLLDVYANTEPIQGAKGYARGCLWHDLANAKLYINTPADESAIWTEVGGVSYFDLGSAISYVESSTCPLERDLGAPTSEPPNGSGSIYCDMQNNEVYIYLDRWRKITLAS